MAAVLGRDREKLLEEIGPICKAIESVSVARIRSRCGYTAPGQSKLLKDVYVKAKVARKGKSSNLRRTCAMVSVSHSGLATRAACDTQLVEDRRRAILCVGSWQRVL